MTLPPTRLVLGLAGLAVLVAPLRVGTSQPTARIIRVEASSFSYRPSAITVQPGDTVTLEVVATDVVHGLYIDGYELFVTADPGQTAHLTFVADRAGTFRIRCSVGCGPLHPFMTGILRVGLNTFLWRAAALALLAVTFAGVGHNR